MAGVIVTDGLEAFFRDLARRPFAYGSTDCALVIADRWLQAHGADPAAHLRGAYGTEDECAAVLAANGHLPRLVARLARSVGAPRTDDPKPGDFAVVRHQGRWWGAIRTPSGRWAIKAHDGLACLRNVRVVAAWSV